MVKFLVIEIFKHFFTGSLSSNYANNPYFFVFVKSDLRSGLAKTRFFKEITQTSKKNRFYRLFFKMMISAMYFKITMFSLEYWKWIILLLDIIVLVFCTSISFYNNQSSKSWGGEEENPPTPNSKYKTLEVWRRFCHSKCQGKVIFRFGSAAFIYLG